MGKKGLVKSIEPFLEKIEKLSKVQRILISSIIFVLIAGIFIYFFYWPKFEDLRSLSKKQDNLEKKLSAAKRNAADLEKFQAKMKEAEALFKLAMNKLPENEEIPSLLSNISNSGQEVGLEFLLFKPESEKPKEFYAEIPVALKIKGDYHNLAIFFDEVARLSRIVNIRDIQMVRAKGGSSKILNTKCTAVTYKFIDTPAKKKSKKKNRKRRK